VERKRALAWLRRWGASLASLGGGLFTLFVFRRGLPNVGWIVGYLLLLSLLFIFFIEMRQPLENAEHRARRLIATAVDYTLQTLYHGLLLFVLPAYYAAATLTSLNAAFLTLLVALALLATFDPWYRAVVQPRRWLGYLFFIVSIFASLNVALPLVGLPPFPALLASAFLASVALTPAVRRRRGSDWLAALRSTVAVGVVAATAVALGRVVIPPAPLFLARAELVWDVIGIDARELAPDTIGADELRQRGLVAYTAIYAPAGLSQPIIHVWRRNGQVVNIVTLSPVQGGRREGFRTYSRKTSFPADSTGRWTVDVETSSGQLIGRLRFHVTP
jgi:hypothetical protein